MSGFTAQDAREIVAEESFSSKGYVIDQIRKAAKNSQQTVTIPDLKLVIEDQKALQEDGFKITGKTISWKE